MLGDVNKLFVFKSMLTTPSNVLPLHLKQNYRPIIWILTGGEGDWTKSKLPLYIKNNTFMASRKKLRPTVLGREEDVLIRFDMKACGGSPISKDRVQKLPFFVDKGQTNSKWFFQADISSKKQTNKFDFTRGWVKKVHWLF